MVILKEFVSLSVTRKLAGKGIRAWEKWNGKPFSSPDTLNLSVVPATLCQPWFGHCTRTVKQTIHETTFVTRNKATWSSVCVQCMKYYEVHSTSWLDRWSNVVCIFHAQMMMLPCHQRQSCLKYGQLKTCKDHPPAVSLDSSFPISKYYLWIDFIFCCATSGFIITQHHYV